MLYIMRPCCTQQTLPTSFNSTRTHKHTIARIKQVYAKLFTYSRGNTRGAHARFNIALNYTTRAFQTPHRERTTPIVRWGLRSIVHTQMLYSGCAANQHNRHAEYAHIVTLSIQRNFALNRRNSHTHTHFTMDGIIAAYARAVSFRNGYYKQ